MADDLPGLPGMDDGSGFGPDTLSHDPPGGDAATLGILPDAEGAEAAPAGHVAIIIVGFRNAGDVVGCLRALSRAAPRPGFDIVIAENGGTAAVVALRQALTAPAGPCRALSPGDEPAALSLTPDADLFRLTRGPGMAGTIVQVVPMVDNLGYAGAINVCLRRMLQRPGWDAVWILNPDTEPMPTALQALADHAATHNVGMVGSRITAAAHPDNVLACGLKWGKFKARTEAIGLGTPPGVTPDADVVAARQEAPCGTSMYVTRALISRIGLMDERYFLYFEDLEWGCRAQRIGQLGYAQESIVPHVGGTTIGSAEKRAGRSRLAVYLDFRNRILFVRQLHPIWLPWTVAMQLLHLAAFAGNGSLANAHAGWHGLLAGLRGEVGKPDGMMRQHSVSATI
jgi:GT2 family glycosyltransferase